MIAIKMSGMQKLPESCDDCIYFASRPHPFKGWTDLCELCVQCLDDDQPDGWIYGGDNRPKNCPLIDLEAIQADQTQNKWHDLRKHPEDLPEEYATVEVILSTVKIVDIAVYCKEYGFRPWYSAVFEDALKALHDAGFELSEVEE